MDPDRMVQSTSRYDQHTTESVKLLAEVQVDAAPIVIAILQMFQSDWLLLKAFLMPMLQIG